MKCSCRLGLFSSLFLVSSTALATLSLSTSPLAVSTVVEPNVMLLIDNSGSMDSIVYEQDFYSQDRSSQPEWKAWIQRHNGSDWYWDDVPISNSEGNIRLWAISQGTCSNGYKRFWRGSSVKCIRLPDPAGGGNTRYSGEYLNYLINRFNHNSNLTSGAITSQTRMEVAKSTASQVVSNTPGMRFGVSRFYGPSSQNYAHGAYIDRACGSSTSDINSSIAGYSASANTPLSEALYEITRYFRGMSSWYRSGVNYTSPIQYRCQKNFTIAITDGFPTYDSYFDTNDRDIPAGKSLPNWDGKAPATSSASYPNFPDFSDGFGGSTRNEGATLYLDDIAKFAWDIDFKTSGNDSAGVSYNDAGFPIQNMYTYTVGFATQNAMLQNAAEGETNTTNGHKYGHGAYYTATNADQLTTVLKEALSDIAKKTGSSSSAAASTGRIQAGSRVYQARYNSNDWSGQLLAYDIEPDKTKPTYGQLKVDGPGPNGSAFDVADKLPAWNSRTILTNIGSLAKSFEWGQFTGAQRALYFSDEPPMLDYLRGRNDSTTSSYRSRSSNLGDIVNSSPSYVGRPRGVYRDDLEGVTGSEYSTFVNANKNRTPMVYVGANDGMLHGFDADTGVEKLAFIPGSLLPKLKELSENDYTHQYFVDGTPTVVDAYDKANNKWRSVLVSGLNGGGQAIFALDVTNPNDFSASNPSKTFMWEFTDTQDVSHRNLGFTYTQPKVIRMHDGNWYAVFGNGYNNTVDNGADGSNTNDSVDGQASLFIVNLWDGTLVKEITTGVGSSQDPTGQNRPNGLGTVTPVDIDGDSISDYIYAGDLFGNVWKFDITGNTVASWDLDYRLFTACEDNGCSVAQPITSPVTVNFGPSGLPDDYMVYFGTGKYIEIGDNNGSAGGVQSFYGIRDQGSSVTNKSKLLEQEILSEVSVNFVNKNGTPNDTSDDYNDSAPLRLTSDNKPTNAFHGWYIDLVPPAGERGERLISAPVLRNDRVYFVTLIPSDDPCAPAGDSWLMSMHSMTGGRLDQTFDIDNSRDFGTSDKVFTPGGGTDAAATGVKTASGGNSPTFMPGVDGDQIFVSGSDGGNSVGAPGSGSGQGAVGGHKGPHGEFLGRQSWRQLIND